MPVFAAQTCLALACKAIRNSSNILNDTVASDVWTVWRKRSKNLDPTAKMPSVSASCLAIPNEIQPAAVKDARSFTRNNHTIADLPGS